MWNIFHTKGVKTAILYQTADNTSPYLDWYNSLGFGLMATVDVRIDRAVQGNLGDCEPVGEGVHELRIHIGPGYRVYFANDGLETILLLMGGDKSDQKTDIKLAKKYFADYKARKPQQTKLKKK